MKVLEEELEMKKHSAIISDSSYKEKVVAYSRLVNSLPKFFSSEDVINYHQYLSNKLRPNTISNFQRSLLEELRISCSSESYKKLEKVINDICPND